MHDHDDEDDMYDGDKKRMSLYGDAFALYENALKQIRDELKDLVCYHTIIIISLHRHICTLSHYSSFHALCHNDSQQQSKLQRKAMKHVLI
jgi:hypothetical protein